MPVSLKPVAGIPAAHTHVDALASWENVVNSLASYHWAAGTAFEADGPELTISGDGAYEHLALGGELRDAAKVELSRTARPKGYRWMTADAATPGVVVLTISGDHVEGAF